MKSLLPLEWQRWWSIRDDVNRSERFKELAFAGYRIPRCGYFNTMKRLNVPLVVYTDAYAHCGEGKRLWKPGDPDKVKSAWNPFCSEYIACKNAKDGAFSRRQLVVGSYWFRIDYHSPHEWMSNVNGSYTVHTLRPDVVKALGSPDLKKDRTFDYFQYPMYAIDEIEAGEGVHESDEWYAVDLNVCPGVPLEVVNLVGRDVLTESVRQLCERLAPPPA